MSQPHMQNEELMQLKQTIIYLRAELNKYKNQDQHASSIKELYAENEKLTREYKELLHIKKKQDKRLLLYERRIRSLEFQRGQSLSALDRIQSIEKDLRKTNSQLLRTLVVINNQRLSETTKNIDRIELKLDTILHKLTTDNQLSFPQNELLNLTHELTETKEINAKQQELIRLLDEYIQELMRAPHPFSNYLTEY